MIEQEIDRFKMLERRLAQLEARGKVLRWGLLITISTALCLGLLDRSRASMDQELRGREISLVDDQGKVRASLKMTDGAPGLVIYGRSGDPRLEASVGPDDAPGICLYDKRGQGRATFEMSGDTSQLSFNSIKGEELVSLGLHYDGTSYLNLYSKTRKGYWKAP